MISTSFLPLIFGLLQVSDRGKPFNLGPWIFTELEYQGKCFAILQRIAPVEINKALDGDIVSGPLLAAHLYYRGLQLVPSLIRQWWEGCKNRQLYMNVTAYTAKHFSPILIANELAHLHAGGKETLNDENLTIKVFSGGVNEVRALYEIDEQIMEISIRLPNEYPLQGVEVKDVRKVGVSDAQWRAWILAVQQTITTQVNNRV